MSFEVRQLTAHDLDLMDAMLETFAQGFDDEENYSHNRPSPEYLRRLLGRDTFIALVALQDEQVVGALAAYELHKFEQERSELYIYDLAVLEAYRRAGVATGLIAHLQKLGAERGAWVIFVQADTDEDDQPAIALYTKLGTREEVLHFDIPISREN
ncbi:MAG: AAC(3)-I family aminoglycoside N-acetyltransferase [Myxococcota bacterium]